jgi:hypothetical protein
VSQQRHEPIRIESDERLKQQLSSIANAIILLALPELRGLTDRDSAWSASAKATAKPTAPRSQQDDDAPDPPAETPS